MVHHFSNHNWCHGIRLFVQKSGIEIDVLNATAGTTCYSNKDIRAKDNSGTKTSEKRDYGCNVTKTAGALHRTRSRPKHHRERASDPTNHRGCNERVDRQPVEVRDIPNF